ncbi:MAG: four helix bundle protein [Patescibacteria group bacterium]
MLYIALELGYITKTKFEEIYDLSHEISRILGGFIRKL